MQIGSIRDQPGAQGRIVGASQTALDMTEQKKEQRRRTEELETIVAERTAELQETISVLDSFCHTIAHDLRAPLRALNGFSKELQETHARVLDDEGKETLNRIASAANRMDRLILDLLRLGRISTTELRSEPVPLEAVVEEAQLVLSAELSRTAARLRVCYPLHMVHGNRVLLSQIVTNLLANGIKFVPPGTIPEVTIRSEQFANRVKLWVEDNGIGIKSTQKSKLFQPFLRLVPADEYPGTGVGLAIVRKAAERLGGKVGVESEAGKGSRFWLDLPAGANGPG